MPERLTQPATSSVIVTTPTELLQLVREAVRLEVQQPGTRPPHLPPDVAKARAETRCATCGKSIEVAGSLVEEFDGCLVCDDCGLTTDPHPCETCGKDECNGECCTCEYCVERRRTAQTKSAPDRPRCGDPLLIDAPRCFDCRHCDDAEVSR